MRTVPFAHRKSLLYGLLGAVLVVAASPVEAEVWSQFRGPSGQGQVANRSIPLKWSETEGIVWKTSIPGIGHSSPVHTGKLIWMTTAPKDGSTLNAIGVNPTTGKIEHNVKVFEPNNVERIHHDNSYASPTPVLKDGRLYVHFGTYGTACIDTESAEVLWRNNNFPVSHQGGPGSSPILFEDLLIITLDGADTQRLVALELETGKARWVRARSAPMPESIITHRAFSTPLIMHSQGRDLLLSPGAHQFHAYDPRTGDEIWHVRYVGFSNVPRPVANETMCFLCTGFFNPELWAIDPTGSGDVTETHIQWKFKGVVPETPSPLLVGDSIYILSNNGIMTSLHAETGKREWVLRVGGNYSASPILAGGLVYICNERGHVKVVDTQLEKPRIIQRNRLDGRIMASPAVVDDDLLIRTEEHLYRIHEE